METIALVGQSGTGKSHRALIVAHKYQADAIIDDGILIKNGKIIAGQSAKHEKNKIMAVRRAIFVLPGHAEEVKKALDEVKPQRLLIIGTSENMVGKIAKKLGLPPISHFIRIEDVASKAEMAKAQFYRLKEGKHIIPVPTIELAAHFSGFLIDPIISFFKSGSKQRRRIGEKSIVRPVFSYYGKLTIEDRVVEAIASRLICEENYIKSVDNVEVIRAGGSDEDVGGGGVSIACDIVLSAYGRNIPQLINEAQQKAKAGLEMMTGMVVLKVDINVKSLVISV